jgi:uncharacterized cupin superfamily protein
VRRVVDTPLGADPAVARYAACVTPITASDGGGVRNVPPRVTRSRGGAILPLVKKIDVEKAPIRVGSSYPEPYDVPCRERQRWRLGVAAGLTGFGVNLSRLPPGAWSSQRHWHTADDEFIYVLEGEVVLVTDAGEEVLRAGDCAGFKAGADGHHLQNRSDHEAVMLEVGTNTPGDEVHFPDIDLHALASGSPTPTARYLYKDGRPYGPRRT